jgi:hypothetical protein
MGVLEKQFTRDLIVLFIKSTAGNKDAYCHIANIGSKG